MPDLVWNKNAWDKSFTWKNEGDEWSAGWGGTYPQWVSTIYPRIGKFLPTAGILEIAPGFGRWSQFLIPSSTQYWGVDLAEKCIDHCKIRFAKYNHACFINNDGVSLDMVPENSIDFCFSFDSLVHVEMDILEKYLSQIIRKLTKNGVAFLHHSNFKEYYEAGLQNYHYRAISVNAATVFQAILNSYGKVIIQEKVNWGESPQNLIDCFTLLCRKETELFITEPKVIDNDSFVEEMNYSLNIFSRYDL